jgi:DNA-binding NarL/FixJ family response regulator
MFDSGRDTPVHTGIKRGANARMEPNESASGGLSLLSIGLIDSYLLTQDCLTVGLRTLRPEIKIAAFLTVPDCVAAARRDFELILFYLHGNDVSNKAVMQALAAVGSAFPGVPVVILSDADRLRQTTIMQFSLDNGARGFVPTQSTGILIVSAAINLVTAGGTFMPADLMFTRRLNHAPRLRNGLTSKQTVVLGHLRQGKANKVIAHELGMSESTVKVHVRNIMRKMGANNRTQAVYKAQAQSNDADSAT